MTFGHSRRVDDSDTTVAWVRFPTRSSANELELFDFGNTIPDRIKTFPIRMAIIRCTESPDAIFTVRNRESPELDGHTSRSHGVTGEAP